MYGREGAFPPAPVATPAPGGLMLDSDGSRTATDRNKEYKQGCYSKVSKQNIMPATQNAAAL